jgi:hypothetical protein
MISPAWVPSALGIIRVDSLEKVIEKLCMSTARSAGPAIPVYDPYGPGDSHDFDVIT